MKIDFRKMTCICTYCHYEGIKILGPQLEMYIPGGLWNTSNMWDAGLSYADKGFIQSSDIRSDRIRLK